MKLAIGGNPTNGVAEEGGGGGGVGVYPQMPVLLIATVTHPSGRSSPLLFLRLSRLGVDSSTHSLCSGLVKTPTFGLEMVSMVVVVDIWSRSL